MNLKKAGITYGQKRRRTFRRRRAFERGQPFKRRQKQQRWFSQFGRRLVTFKRITFRKFFNRRFVKQS
jgi:hypothetical protein